jgi:hypothetical protein
MLYDREIIAVCSEIHADLSGRALRRESATDRLLELQVRISPGAWISVPFKCCVLSGRGTFVAPITYPEKTYRLKCIIVCNLETLRMRWSLPGLDCCAKEGVMGPIQNIKSTLWGQNVEIIYFNLVVHKFKTSNPSHNKYRPKTTGECEMF